MSASLVVLYLLPASMKSTIVDFRLRKRSL
jgi:hypothetical protein